MRFGGGLEARAVSGLFPQALKNAGVKFLTLLKMTWEWSSHVSVALAIQFCPISQAENFGAETRGLPMKLKNI